MDATAGQQESVESITRQLATGLHELANAAGRLEQLVVDGAEIDEDQHLALDQAHSNATALLRTLDRIGLG